jgi:hypothetical protein
MKIEFTDEEVKQILLDHANKVVQTGDKPFNKVDCNYSYIPSTVSVVREEPKEEAQCD